MSFAKLIFPARQTLTNARTTVARVDYLLYGDPQYPALMSQNRWTIAAEAAAVFADLIGAFFPPLCIHLLMGCLCNDTSLGYQAPFPASARSLRGRYPYGTQTHPPYLSQTPASACLERYRSPLCPAACREKKRDRPPRNSLMIRV